MVEKKYKKLGELLTEFNFITHEQFKEAMKKQEDSNRKLGQILVDLGYISEDDLIQVLEFQLGIPHADLSSYVFDSTMADYIPERMARRYNAVPLEVEGEKLNVAMSDPSNLVAIEDMEMASGLKIEPFIASQKSIEQALTQIYTLDDTEDVFESLGSIQRNEEPEMDELKQMVEDAPVVRLANLIVKQALQMRASDIHIEPMENEVRIRYRVDGVLRASMTAPKYSQAALISRMKIIADLDITRRRIPQDGRISINVGGHRVDMRVSTLPTIHGEKVVIRLLNKDESLLHMKNLGFTEKNLATFRRLIQQPHGILLVTGPTGSGKSTTLFAALNHLNSTEDNIVTIEDPVEFRLDGINQVQANQRAGLTFARTLRSILRQDPDIIMVGEIRDEETAQIAVRAALTGHLVLSTLHTNDAVSSVTRLVDMGIPPYLVASTVIGAMAQRLVRRLCRNCREKYEPGIEQLMAFEEDEQKVDYLYQPGGCTACNSTGYKGRLAVHEILEIDSSVEKMIVEDADEQTIKNYAISEGMDTLAVDARKKVLKGYTSYQEYARVIV
ncbi:MAG: GspE/PulE family protein [Halanaerobiaceae bacterium]